MRSLFRAHQFEKNEKKDKTTSMYRLGLLYKHIFHRRPRLLVEYQVTRDKFSNMPKIYYNSCLISKSRKTRYTSYPEVDVNEVRRTRLSFSQSNTCGATSHVLGFETINGEEFIACNLYYMICVVSSCHEKFSYSESCSTYSERRDQTIPEWSLIGR